MHKTPPPCVVAGSRCEHCRCLLPPVAPTLLWYCPRGCLGLAGSTGEPRDARIVCPNPEGIPSHHRRGNPDIPSRLKPVTTISQLIEDFPREATGLVAKHVGEMLVVNAREANRRIDPQAVINNVADDLRYGRDDRRASPGSRDQEKLPG